MNRLIRDHIVPRFSNGAAAAVDGAVLAWSAGRLVFTTDSYVVTPVEFPGGDIGRLAVCGTVNDLAVMGATPEALSLGLILEEGLPMSVLDRILASAAAAADAAGVRVVTGDTKVIEARRRRRRRDDQHGGRGADAAGGGAGAGAGAGRRRGGAERSDRRARAGDPVSWRGDRVRAAAEALSDARRDELAGAAGVGRGGAVHARSDAAGWRACWRTCASTAG
ncbi:MAG: AIR synthase related protein [Phycisphaerae bacterium]